MTSYGMKCPKFWLLSGHVQFPNHRTSRQVVDVA